MNLSTIKALSPNYKVALLSWVHNIWDTASYYNYIAIFTLTWLIKIVMAAADVNAFKTGNDM